MKVKVKSSVMLMFYGLKFRANSGCTLTVQPSIYTVLLIDYVASDSLVRHANHTFVSKRARN